MAHSLSPLDGSRPPNSILPSAAGLYGHAAVGQQVIRTEILAQRVSRQRVLLHVCVVAVVAVVAGGGGGVVCACWASR